MAFCENCGKQLDDGAKFCNVCGKSVTGRLVQHQPDTNATTNISLWQGYVSFWKNYANFKGRARRKEYWGAALFNIVFVVGLSIVGGFIGGFIGGIVSHSTLPAAAASLTDAYLHGAEYGSKYGTVGGSILYNLYGIAVAIPGFAVCWRRLHDIGKSGANYWWCLTIVGVIPLLIWLCRDSEVGENKYGKNPKGYN